MILYVNLHTHLIIILFHVVSRLLPFGGVEIQSPLRIDNSIKNDWQIFFYCLVGEKRCVEFSISRCRTFCGANRSKSLHISLFSLVWVCLSGQLSHTFTNSRRDKARCWSLIQLWGSVLAEVLFFIILNSKLTVNYC